MNVKIIIVLLCSTQLVVGSDSSAPSGLKQQIEDIEKNVVQSVQNTWNNAVAQAKQNLDTIKTQTDTEVQKRISQIRNLTANISECVNAEKDDTQKLVDNAKSQIEVYATLKQAAVNNLIAKLNATISDGKALIAFAMEQLDNCSKIVDFFDQVNCFTALGTPVLQQSAAISKNLANLAVLVQNESKNALTDFQSTAKTITSITTTQATAIVTETWQCITNKTGKQ